MPSRQLPTYFLFQATSTAVFSSSIFVVYYERRVGSTLAAVLGLQAYNTGLRAVVPMIRVFHCSFCRGHMDPASPSARAGKIRGRPARSGR